MPVVVARTGDPERPIDPLTVEWLADGRVIYTTDRSIRVGTAKSARVAKQIVLEHNTALTKETTSMPNEDPNKKSFESSHLMSPAPGTPQTKDKAVVGGLIAAVASALVGYVASGQDVSLKGAIAVVVAGVAGYFGVALKRNKAL